MKQFKIVYGYNESDFISIKGDELHKALALFMSGSGRGNFEGGAVRGQDIMRIVPDWHTVMGWNKGYKMGADDFAQIEPLEKEYKIAYQLAKDIAEFAVRENRPELLTRTATEALLALPEKMKEILQIA